MFEEFVHVLRETQEKQFADAFPAWLEMYFSGEYRNYGETFNRSNYMPRSAHCEMGFPVELASSTRAGKCGRDQFG